MDLAVAVCRYRLLVRVDERGLDLVVDTPVQRFELQSLEQCIGADFAAIESSEDG